MDHRKQNATSRLKPRRACRWPLGLLMVGAVVSGSPVRGEETPEMVEIRGQVLPVWPIEDLRRRGYDIPDIPRAENAAWVYLEAINAYPDVPESLRPAFDYALKETWPKDATELRRWVTRKENREAIKLARRAAAMPRCQFPYFGDAQSSVIEVILPNLSGYRQLAKLMVVDGQRLAAQRDYAGAMENLAVALRMGHHLEGGLTLIEGLVGQACWSLSTRTIRGLVLRHQVPRGQMANLFETWAALKPLEPTLQRGFEGERLLGPAIVEELVSCPTRRNLLGVLGREYPTDYRRPESGWDQLRSRLGHLFLPDRTIKQHMNMYYDTIAEIAALPHYDPRVAAFSEAEVFEEIPEWDFMSHALLPALSRARLLGVRRQTETRATTLTLALRLHLLQSRGKPPARWADLSVEVPPDDLIDPFSGNEFVYRRTTNGWKFYSLGPNGVDDGGRTGKTWEDQDMVFEFPPAPLEPFAPEEE